MFDFEWDGDFVFSWEIRKGTRKYDTYPKPIVESWEIRKGTGKMIPILNQLWKDLACVQEDKTDFNQRNSFIVCNYKRFSETAAITKIPRLLRVGSLLTTIHYFNRAKGN